MRAEYHDSCIRQQRNVLIEHNSSRADESRFVFTCSMGDRKQLIAQRLREARSAAGMTQGEVASRVSGITQSRLSNWEQATRQPGIDEVERLAQLFGVSAGWILGVERDTVPSTPEPPLDYTLVPRYNVTAGLGEGEVFQSEQVIDELAFRTAWLRARGLQPEKIAVIACRGDSMTPTIRDGDVALVDLRDRDLRRDGIYAIRRDGHGAEYAEIIVKRIQTTLAGTIRIISDNEDYPPEEYAAGHAPEIAVVGRVVWAGGDVR